MPHETASLQRPNSLQHILAELKRVDELIQTEVRRIREQSQNDDQFQGLFVSDQEVDEILATPPCSPRFPFPQGSENALAADRTQFTGSRLGRLAHIFELSQLDIDCLLVCLAPELDTRYERVYAYLQNDVTKKRPGVDLVLNLLCRTVDSKIRGRQLFASNAPLIRHRLLQLFEDSSHPQPTLLGKYLKMDEHIVNYLLESDDMDIGLKSCVKYIEPKTEIEELPLTAENKSTLR